MRYQCVGVVDLQASRERLPVVVGLNIAPFGEYELEYGADDRRLGTQGDAKAQCTQWVEGVHGRELEGDARTVRQPLTLAIGVAALGRNFGGAFLAPVLEKPREQHRTVADLQGIRQPFEVHELQVCVGRDEIEVPVRLHRALLICTWRRTVAGPGND